MTLGISSCLLGERVRFDNSHKHNRYITDTLGEYFAFRPYCPEVAIGLGTPRPPLRLVRFAEEIRVRGVKDPTQDVTEALTAYGEQIGAECDQLCGYIFKSQSPSCGMERVKNYSDQGVRQGSSPGRYAAAVMAANPSLPVEEEGRLMDARLRENFIERVFIYHRWQRYWQQGLTPATLVEFHTRHKLTLLAHDELGYRELGRLVARAGSEALSTLAADYLARAMVSLKKLATPKTHTNVLQHIFGYIKDNLSREDKQELLEVFEAYRTGQVPLIVPMTLLKHYLRRYPNDYISQQYYLQPHPRELQLRNRV